MKLVGNSEYCKNVLDICPQLFVNLAIPFRSAKTTISPVNLSTRVDCHLTSVF